MSVTMAQAIVNGVTINLTKKQRDRKMGSNRNSPVKIILRPGRTLLQCNPKGMGRCRKCHRD